MPYDRGVQLNPEGDKLDCSKIDHATKGMTAHSAPLCMSFLQESGLPSAYRDALVTAQHGCWNCSKLNGHKVVMYPFRQGGSVGNEIDFVTGWVTDAARREHWGRPVDVVPNGKGGVYISDDYSGTIHLLKSQ